MKRRAVSQISRLVPAPAVPSASSSAPEEPTLRSPLSPSEGEPELCANCAAVQLLSGQMRRPTHFCNPSRTNSPPSQSKSACGCAAQLVWAHVFPKGEKMRQVLNIRKKIRPWIDRDFCPSQNAVMPKHWLYWGWRSAAVFRSLPSSLMTK